MVKKAPQLLAFSMLLAVLCLGTVSAMPGERMLAQVPFSFFVGDQAFPAGEYTVQWLNNRHLILKGPNGERTFRLGFPVEAQPYKDRWQLVFNKYPGERIFLSQFWTNGQVGLELVKSSKERALVFTIAGPTRIAINLKPVTDKRRG